MGRDQRVLRRGSVGSKEEGYRSRIEPSSQNPSLASTAGCGLPGVQAAWSLPEWFSCGKRWEIYNQRVLRARGSVGNDEFKELSGCTEEFYRCYGVLDDRCLMPPASWEELKKGFEIWQNIKNIQVRGLHLADVVLESQQEGIPEALLVLKVKHGLEVVDYLGANFSFPNRFTFYSVKATCIKITGIKLSIFQLRLQVQAQFIMAKNWWQCEDSISEPLDPETSALPIRHEQGIGSSGVLTE